MDDYTPNSNRFKTEQKTPPTATPAKRVSAPVVSGKDVIVKKRSGASKLRDIFISDDSVNVKSYVLEEVLIPAAKKAIVDIVKNGIDMIIYGGVRPGSTSSGIGHVSYDRFSDNSASPVTRSRVGYGLDNIIISDYGKARKVLEDMDAILDTYQIVRVADLWDLLGQPTLAADNNYGWTNLRNADVVPCYDGYQLRLPKALPINNIR